MARVNVYLPDELAARARKADLNISSITQQALRRELLALKTDEWLKGVAALAPMSVSHETALAALRAARDEFNG